MPVFDRGARPESGRFPELANHPDLTLTLGWLCTAVQLAMQDRQLSGAGVLDLDGFIERTKLDELEEAQRAEYLAVLQEAELRVQK